MISSRNKTLEFAKILPTANIGVSIAIIGVFVILETSFKKASPSHTSTKNILYSLNSFFTLFTNSEYLSIASFYF